MFKNVLGLGVMYKFTSTKNHDMAAISHYYKVAIMILPKHNIISLFSKVIQ